MLKAFLDWISRLFRSPRVPYNSRADGLLRLDLESLRDNLRPREKGQAAGRENSPRPAATTPDSRELEIQRACEEAAQQAFDDTKRNIETLLLSIHQLGASGRAGEISQASRTAVGQIQTEVASRTSQISRQAERCLEVHKAFESFKASNGLSRPATYPSDKLLYVGVLVGMVVVEAGMNGVWFAQGNQQGLLGGIAQALVFAVCNVGLGVLAGRLILGLLFHRSTLRKLVGVVLMVAYATVALSLNLAIAHYRDVASTLDGNPGLQAMVALLAHPFGLSELSSWLLLGMGTVFSVLACYDAFKMDDPYPGYGKRDRELTDARDDLDDAQDEALQTIARIRDEGLKMVTAGSKQAGIYSQQRVVLINRLGQAVNDYERYRSAVRDAFRILVEEYREGNRATRTEPPPAYFGSLVALSVPPTPSYPSVREDADLGQHTENALEEIKLAHNQGMDRLRRAQTAAGVAR